MTCPANPPAPAGYAVFKGKVAPELSAWATQILKVSSQYDFGTTWTMQSSGQTVIARLDRHTWHFLPDGTLLTNLCWKGVTLYRSTGIGSAGDAVTNIETATPDPSLAVYDNAPSSVDWPLVAISAAALAATVGLFFMALRAAGRAAT